jgi:hypothetical protein
MELVFMSSGTEQAENITNTGAPHRDKTMQRFSSLQEAKRTRKILELYRNQLGQMTALPVGHCQFKGHLVFRS